VEDDNDLDNEMEDIDDEMDYDWVDWQLSVNGATVEHGARSEAKEADGSEDEADDCPMAVYAVDLEPDLEQTMAAEGILIPCDSY